MKSEHVMLLAVVAAGLAAVYLVNEQKKAAAVAAPPALPAPAPAPTLKEAGSSLFDSLAGIIGSGRDLFNAGKSLFG